MNATIALDLPAGERKLLVAVTYAAVVGEYSLLVMPFIVGAMIDSYGASPQLAGRIVSLQLLGMALSAVTASLLMGRLDKLKTIYAMAGLTIVANVACAIGTGIPVLIAARFATGLGEGALMAIAGSIAAGTSNPRRSFSIIGLAVAIAASVALVLTPYLVDRFGRAGTFWFLASFAAGLLLFAHWTKPLTPAADEEAPTIAATAAGFRTVTAPNALLALSSFGLFWAGCAGLWVFAERIGLGHSLSLQQIGFYLSIGQLAGIPGPICVAWLARRIRLPPLFAVALLATIVSGLIFVFVPLGWAYCLGAVLLSFLSMFLTPAFRTLMALLDRSGAVVAASVAFYTIGFGAAPLLITFFLGEGEDFVPVAMICSVLYALSAVLVLKPAMLVGRTDVDT